MLKAGILLVIIILVKFFIDEQENTNMGIDLEVFNKMLDYYHNPEYASLTQSA